MDQLNTPDGVIYIYDTQRDISDLCRKYISDDVADYIFEVLGDMDKEAMMAQMQFDSDYRTMERELDGWYSEVYDIKSELERISYEADQQPGLSKKKILERIDKLWTHLNRLL